MSPTHRSTPSFRPPSAADPGAIRALAGRLARLAFDAGPGLPPLLCGQLLGPSSGALGASGLEVVVQRAQAPEGEPTAPYRVLAVDGTHCQLADDSGAHTSGTLPGDLHEAVQALEKDDLIKEALGEHIATHFIEAKQREWSEYIAQVHEWELQRYLGTY